MVIVFYPLILNRFPNGFLQWTRDRPEKINDFVSTPYRTHFFIFWLPRSAFSLNFTFKVLRQLKLCRALFKKKRKFYQKMRISQNWLLGVLKPAGYEFGNKNSFDVKLRVYRTILTKILNFAHWPWNLVYSVCWRQEQKYSNEKFVRCSRNF